jgi:hypothetical protein
MVVKIKYKLNVFTVMKLFVFLWILVLIVSVSAADIEINVDYNEETKIGEEYRFSATFTSLTYIDSFEGFFLFNNNLIEFKDNEFLIEGLNGSVEKEFSFTPVAYAYEAIIYPVVKVYFKENQTFINNIGNFDVYAENLTFNINELKEENLPESSTASDSKPKKTPEEKSPWLVILLVILGLMVLAIIAIILIFKKL